MKKISICYVPVFHEGYRKFFEKNDDVSNHYILDKDVIAEFSHLSKEIRQLEPALMLGVIKAVFPKKEIKLLKKKDVERISRSQWDIVMPREDICMELEEKFFKKNKVVFDDIFLRWDKHKSMEERPVLMDQKVSKSPKDIKMIEILKKEANYSSDWWRRIASAVVKNGKVLLIRHNEHMPSPHSPYSDGDPRNNFHKGVGIELSTSIHSEAGIIAESAKKGIKLQGASIYVSVFPCPPCAKMIAVSGIKKLYYAGGYTALDQESILKSNGVEIIYVDMSISESKKTAK